MTKLISQDLIGKARQRNYSWGRGLVLPLILVIMVMGFVSADLGTFKQNSCVEIRTLGNCTLTLIEVTSPKVTYEINTEMTNIGGQTYNYSFCNTTESGKYTYSWSGDCLDCGSDGCGNSFEISPTGFSGTLGFYAIILVLSLGIIILGFAKEDGIVIILGSFGLYFAGLYIILYGIVGIKDVVYTWATGIIVLMLAAYISIRTAWELIVD